MLEWTHSINENGDNWNSGKWEIGLNGCVCLFFVRGHTAPRFPTWREAADWCEQQEQAAKPAEPLPAVGSVWGVPNGVRRIIWAHSNDRKRLYWIDTDKRRSNSFASDWHDWVRETGAVDLLADRGALVAERDMLREAIIAHHSQKADDRCIEDDDRLYAAAGLPPCDRRVGDKEAMLQNCRRFIERRCESGGWPSYVELEKQVEAAEAKYKIASGERDQFFEEREDARAISRQMVIKANELRDQRVLEKKRADAAEMIARVSEQTADVLARRAETAEADAKTMAARIVETANKLSAATKRAETAEHQQRLWEQDSRDKAAEVERWKVLAQDAELKRVDAWKERERMEAQRNEAVRLERIAKNAVDLIVKERDDLRARLKAPVEGEPEWVESFAKGIDWKISTGYACEIATWVRNLIRERDRYARYLDVIAGSYPVRPSGGYPNDAVMSLKALVSEAREMQTNSKLSAAAPEPDLLAACKVMVSKLDNPMESKNLLNDVVDQMRAAIAKAEGGGNG